MIEGNLEVTKRPEELVAKSDGIDVEVTDYSNGAKLKEDIENSMKTLDIWYIYKADSIVEFMYKSKSDEYSIVYSGDKKPFNVYTTVEALGGGWHYCVKVNE